MQRIYGDKRARTAIFAESADQLALEAAAAADDANANGALPSVSNTLSLGCITAAVHLEFIESWRWRRRRRAAQRVLRRMC